MSTKISNVKDAWLELKPCIEKIMSLQSFSRSAWQQSFDTIYEMSLSLKLFGVLGDLYDETEKFLENLVSSRCQSIASSVDFLVTYSKCWGEYCQGLTTLNSFLRPINKFYVARKMANPMPLVENKKVLYINDLGFRIWKTNLLEPLQKKIYWFLKEELKNYRCGKYYNVAVVQAVIKSLIEISENEKSMKVYQVVFEISFLSDIEEYYRIRVGQELQKDDCSQYMKTALQWMTDEEMWCSKFFTPHTILRVKEQCLHKFVVEHVEYLQMEFKKLVPQEEKTDYQNMYKLMKLTGSGLEPITSTIEAHITEVGCTAMRGVTEDNPDLFVKTFMKIREKYLNLINECLDSDDLFTGALDKACITILKCEGHQMFADKAPEVLANFCDRILKKNTKESDEASVEKDISQIIILFTYIKDKDIFQKFYSQLLCRRLLHGTSKSLDFEGIMISKLRQMCGHQFTRKYHEMLTDISMKRNLNLEFSQSIGGSLGFNLDASVLRTSSWPCSGNTFSFAVPQVLERCVTEFDKFYKLKYKGRKLVWLHHMATGDLKLCYLPKPYLISMTTYQMAVLLLFEQIDAMTFAEVKESTKLEDELLSKAIRSLTQAKLLLADHNNSDDDNRIYNLNKNYSNKRLKFRIPPAARNDKKVVAQEEVRNIRAAANDNRKYVLEAAIVRVMKMKKTLEHNALIDEVIKEVSHHFVPQISLIKKCIGGLIDREYLERDPDRQSVYTYIA